MPREHPRDPPPAPPLERRWQFHRLQLIGVPLLLAAPALALTGHLGGARERVELHQSGLGLALEYATRDHLDNWSRLELTIRNESAAPLLDLQAAFARDLLRGLARPQFQPALDRIDGAAYVVALGTLPAGDVRVIALDYQPAEVGRHAGVIHVRSGGRELAQLPVALVTLP
jgi:hypothetical protein